MKCNECNLHVKNLKALSTHIQFKHNNLKKEYYDKWMKHINEGVCKYCQNPTKFTILNNGYNVYCSKACMKMDYAKIKSINNPMHNDSSKTNQRNTNLERYGVTQNTKRPEIKEQIVQTNKLKYGVENVSQNPIIKEKALRKREKTNIEQYGVKCSFSMPYVKNKIKTTNIKKYGVEYVIQNSLIFNKQQKKQYGANSYNENLYYRGTYEKDFLDNFYKILDITQGIPIKYIYDNKRRIYHSDFFIPSLNLIIEIKNSWLAKKDKLIIEAKRNACISQGYKYIMVIDKNYTEFYLFLTNNYTLI